MNVDSSAKHHAPKAAGDRQLFAASNPRLGYNPLSEWIHIIWSDAFSNRNDNIWWPNDPEIYLK
ncbi:hypothetical protein QUB05_33155 [Microcoleus sp. F10-C6]|uniref:hypothetical protein n=1 Tax=unclassified Microcoleus TaxID=2642155 RepID=UPI002FCFF7ED